MFEDNSASVRAVSLGLGVWGPFGRWKRYEKCCGTRLLSTVSGPPFVFYCEDDSFAIAFRHGILPKVLNQLFSDGMLRLGTLRGGCNTGKEGR